MILYQNIWKSHNLSHHCSQLITIIQHKINVIHFQEATIFLHRKHFSLFAHFIPAKKHYTEHRNIRCTCNPKYLSSLWKLTTPAKTRCSGIESRTGRAILFLGISKEEGNWNGYSGRLTTFVIFTFVKWKFIVMQEPISQLERF